MGRKALIGLERAAGQGTHFGKDCRQQRRKIWAQQQGGADHGQSVMLGIARSPPRYRSLLPSVGVQRI